MEVLFHAYSPFLIDPRRRSDDIIVLYLEGIVNSFLYERCIFVILTKRKTLIYFPLPTDFYKLFAPHVLGYKKTRRNEQKGIGTMIRTTCRLEFLSEGDTLTARLTGEIDHHAAAQVREEIDTQIYRYRPKTTVLDLSGIDFMDSSGLGLIMGRIALMRTLGGETVLKNPTDKVLRIVRLSGLERIMKIVREDA